MALFAPASSGTMVVVGEDPDPAERLLLVLIVFVCSSAAAYVVNRCRGAFSDALFTVLQANNAAALLHYADNVYRPVAYAEPRWLYAPHYAVPMDASTSYAAALALAMAACAVALEASTRPPGEHALTRAAPRAAVRRAGWALLAAHCAWALLSLGHLLVEPPSFYSLTVLATVVGEPAIAAATLALLAAMALGLVDESRLLRIPWASAGPSRR